MIGAAAFRAPPVGRPLFNWIQCYADYYGIDFENFLSGIRLAAQTLTSVGQPYEKQPVSHPDRQ